MAELFAAGVVGFTTAGFVTSDVHVPAPVAANVVLVFWQMVWSVPAFGFAVTVMLIVSVHPLTVHT